ncbi:hypothetical protein BDW02DRAFT_624808 [Decorospora gaudefroyi]|uniref:Effector 5 n=1 Tax=Decorospora gaudefroyi TaxID=184978 RepID=A0A6A5K955_9PLEO|nr:hypothetical protein BDW02DRAFT_624808 [Decorospora gaudefroyi]
MRYSSAVVLSTIAVGQAAAANLHNRHASFHARRQASEGKRSADTEVDWSKVAYDLNDVDWSSVFATPTPAAAAKDSPVAEVQAAEATAEAPAYKPKPSTTVAKPAKTSASKPAATSSSSDDNDDIADSIGDFIDDLMHGVETLASKLGCKVGKNDKSNNGGIWIGDDSDWKAEFTNEGNEDAVLYCWKADGFSGMIIKDNTPEISVGVKSGQTVNISFAPNVPAACAPAFSDTKMAFFGGLEQTWWEVTFGEWGCFDVSRNVNMNGNSIRAKGSKCVSDMDTCVYKCRDSGASSCEAGSDYDLFNCNASGGGGGGYDPIMAGTGGGCAMGSNGESVKVAFS